MIKKKLEEEYIERRENVGGGFRFVNRVPQAVPHQVAIFDFIYFCRVS